MTHVTFFSQYNSLVYLLLMRRQMILIYLLLFAVTNVATNRIFLKLLACRLALTLSCFLFESTPRLSHHFCLQSSLTRYATNHVLYAIYFLGNRLLVFLNLIWVKSFHLILLSDLTTRVGEKHRLFLISH